MKRIYANLKNKSKKKSHKTYYKFTTIIPLELYINVPNAIISLWKTKIDS